MVRQIRAQKTLEITRKSREYKLKSDIGLHDQSTDYFVAEPLRVSVWGAGINDRAWRGHHGICRQFVGFVGHRGTRFNRLSQKAIP